MNVHRLAQAIKNDEHILVEEAVGDEADSSACRALWEARKEGSFVSVSRHHTAYDSVLSV